jgi:hypothetical protein
MNGIATQSPRAEGLIPLVFPELILSTYSVVPHCSQEARAKR